MGAYKEQATNHGVFLTYLQDLDADHRVSHNILEGVKVSVLYDGSGDCIIWLEEVNENHVE